jgi:hypothetical protein
VKVISAQELFGLGIANLVGSVFSAYPATGSFSRSAVSNEVSSFVARFYLPVGTFNSFCSKSKRISKAGAVVD